MSEISSSGLHVSTLLGLDEVERLEFLEGLSEDEADIILHDWLFWARPNQLAPPGDWNTWLLLAGRGFGKTRAGIEWVISKARDHPTHIAIVGETKADIRDVLIEKGESSLLSVSPPWFMPDYEPSKRRCTWPNGTYATLYSGDTPDQLRGPQHEYALVDELAKYRYPQDTWDNLQLGLRMGKHPQVAVATTPRPIKIMRELLKDEDTVLSRGSTYENLGNLAPTFIKYVLKRYEGTTLGRQELYAELLEDIEGALWSRDLVDSTRVSKMPETMVRLVIGVDPPGGQTECGIVGAGLGLNGDVYVVADDSLLGSPASWGNQVVATYYKMQAGQVLGEVNFGGDMVESILRNIDATISYKSVRASRGKAVRAQPVASLYEQGRVHHVGQFALMEDEMCGWVPGESDWSPNRLDALVWAVTELLVEQQREVQPML